MIKQILKINIVCDDELALVFLSWPIDETCSLRLITYFFPH